jgi:PadR family transcriptional regulator PadR
MYICPMYSSELIKGTLKTIVLNLLKEQGRMYGYEITQRVKELTAEKIQITEGALYPTLHALEAQGDLQTEQEFIGKRVRKYYSLTDQGKSTAQEKVNELTDFMNTLRFLLNSTPATGNV